MTVRRKILVVDDDPELRALLASYLNKHGYDTLVAAHANELEAQIARFSPDLLVLDWMMPGRDGLSTCRHLRAQQEDIPIILLTAKDELVDRVMV
jgi:two-component system, OmpR family, phosphate regulon response regulator OmpR